MIFLTYDLTGLSRDRIILFVKTMEQQGMMVYSGWGSSEDFAGVSSMFSSRPNRLYFIGRGRAGLSARQWCNYIVNSHFVSDCELHTGHSLYLAHFPWWHDTRSTLLPCLLAQSRSVMAEDAEGLRGWQRQCSCLNGTWLATFPAVPFICVAPSRWQ